MATVHYRYHPFHGDEVEVLRRLRRSPTDAVLVQVCRSGAQVVVPCWMLDAAICQGLRDGATPLISVAALHALRLLLDSQPLLASARQKEQKNEHIPKKRR